MIERVIIIVMDSVGVGSLPDAGQFNDQGANTLLHIHEQAGPLELPNLFSLGLGKIVDLGPPQQEIVGCRGKMAELSAGKDTTSGHWELAGLVLHTAFPTFPDGFPREIMEPFEKRIGTKTLGNHPESGTEIIKNLGSEHLKTGFPIVYTSADSVFQIAAHEDVTPLEVLYEYCGIAREILVGPYAAGRVIARPFRGAPGTFYRNNGARKDFSVEPPEETLLDMLKAKGFFTSGIGKIGDIFVHRGLTDEAHTENNMDGVDKTLESMKKHRGERGLIFVNLVDFDMLHGHRRDPGGYARALMEFDSRLPEIMNAMAGRDVLMITADHGCDPTHKAHTDHTREYAPLLIYGAAVRKDVDLGIRASLADAGQSAAHMLGAGRLKNGTSFKKEVLT
ncbi:MAG: phosphopentomutase [Desulfobacterales bacterium]|nr:phosphopentomutase [Desulfobacterales bacterium]